MTTIRSSMRYKLLLCFQTIVVNTHLKKFASKQTVAEMDFAILWHLQPAGMTIVQVHWLLVSEIVKEKWPLLWIDDKRHFRQETCLLHVPSFTKVAVNASIWRRDLWSIRSAIASHDSKDLIKNNSGQSKHRIETIRMIYLDQFQNALEQNSSPSLVRFFHSRLSHKMTNSPSIMAIKTSMSSFHTAYTPTQSSTLSSKASHKCKIWLDQKLRRLSWSMSPLDKYAN